MKKYLTTVLSILFGAVMLSAQNFNEVQPADTAVKLVSVFDMLPENLVVDQPETVRNAMDAHVERNAKREAAGYLKEQTYRIRIYFDNGRNARAESEAAAERFRSLHPGVSVSRTFTSPFFKVTVGNYTSKASAAKALPAIQRDFPTAFIVRDNK